MSSRDVLLTLDTVLCWARSGHESDKVYRFIFLHPEDLFTIPKGRSWPIAHQVIYNGDVNLLKRILALFSDDQINIRTLSKDQKTLLDVAKERSSVYRSMYTYVEHLFLQDDLIQAAKQSNWYLVNDILKKNSDLSNEKPPYSTYFLLHYVIQNGNRYILGNLLKSYRFQMNVVSAQNETLIDMAKRLGKTDMYSILEPTRHEESRSSPTRSRSSLPSSNSKNRPCINPQISIFSLPFIPLHPATSKLPYPIIDPFPGAMFSNVLLNLSSSGNFTLKTQNKFTTIESEPSKSEEEHQVINTKDKHVDSMKTISDQDSEPNVEQPAISPASNTQLMKNLTCFLTQEIFIDPVIASDGQTYEREDIMEWVNLYHCSPMTGAPMNETFKENTELKKIIQSMRQQN
ncbi:unnamed protein product [Rotaria sp. Silwood2]|nr:unnamed protein product [Rotaria sp. Silwood2]CAF4378286.1 unnamed protein product [Rotaria sp. Silwood2]